MYKNVNVIESDHFMQGDIIIDFPFPRFMKQETNGHQSEIRERPIILLSQSCDLQPGQGDGRFIASPIQTIDKLESEYSVQGLSGKKITSKVSSLKGQKMIGVMYLKGCPGVGDAYTSFSEMVSMDIISLDGRLVETRLSDRGRHFLAHKLNEFFCRAIDPSRG